MQFKITIEDRSEGTVDVIDCDKLFAFCDIGANCQSVYFECDLDMLERAAEEIVETMIEEVEK